jgi:hypothetical protein
VRTIDQHFAELFSRYAALGSRQALSEQIVRCEPRAAVAGEAAVLR